MVAPTAADAKAVQSQVKRVIRTIYSSPSTHGAALVAGVAAKKLGLFAVIAAFLAKFAKVGILAAAALGGGLWKRLRGKKADTQQP
ncbi:hypothetical protein G6F54_014513 [Rhizopus delemar]|nr:hypothetical protein G6F54_014513 [Rhizopus delemar]